jgi:cell division protein FtsQ
MDGQRRVAQPMTKQNSPSSLRVRIAARVGAVLFLGFTVMHSVSVGGYLSYEGSPWLKIPGKLSGLIGMAAGDIRIQGLVNQEPEKLLAALGIKPGASLIGFDADKAKQLLENLDWVSAATVQRHFPNQLEISVTERVPFAIWQRDGSYYVIDQSGSAMSNVTPGQLEGLLLVTGEGAQFAAQELVNQLEVTPNLLLRVKAAARVGQRRWNLYLDNGITIQLPERDVEAALARLDALDTSQQLLSKGIRNVDLRLSGRVIVGVAEVAADQSVVKVSQSD